MTRTASGPSKYRCSFCGKAQSQVRRLIAGVDRAFICDECVVLCDQMVAEEGTAPTPEANGPLVGGLKPPKKLYQELEEYVVGQERAKKVLSVAVYNHYKRLRSQALDVDDVELQKSNVLMLGPAGCGKTMLAETLARTLDVPFAIADATSLTEAGYVGEDVENILLRLIQAADGDIAKAEQGIIYIDEIDKISRKSPNPSITRDVSGEGVQQSLLKIVEGCIANVPPQGGRKHPHQEFLQIRTDNILFMCGGAFEGLADIIEKRVNKDTFQLGFQPRGVSEDQQRQREKLFESVSADDLLSYGFIPEFVGRLPVVVSLSSLDKEALVRVLVEPKNAVVRQYQSLFKMDNIELEFTQEALEATADEALKQNIGARGLRTILERTLLDVMFELPSVSSVTGCVVDEDAILGMGIVHLSSDEDETVPMPTLRQKSA